MQETGICLLTLPYMWVGSGNTKQTPMLAL